MKKSVKRTRRTFGLGLVLAVTLLLESSSLAGYSANGGTGDTEDVEWETYESDRIDFEIDYPKGWFKFSSGDLSEEEILENLTKARDEIAKFFQDNGIEMDIPELNSFKDVDPFFKWLDGLPDNEAIKNLDYPVELELEGVLNAPRCLQSELQSGNIVISFANKVIENPP